MFKKIKSLVSGSSQDGSVESQLRSEPLNKVSFLRNADNEFISKLVEVINPVRYAKGDIIFREGEAGDSFYMITGGKVEVKSQEEVIAEVGVGGCFGEGALLTDGVRGATVTALENLSLFEIKRDSFTKISEKYLQLRYRLKLLHEGRRAEGVEESIKENLLENAPFLACAGKKLIEEMAKFLKPKTYNKGEVLIREGEEGTHFILIEEGMVEVQVGSKHLAQLGPGACIGEGALLDRHTSSATVTALAETSSFIMEKGPFNRILDRFPVFERRLRGIKEGRS